jgi:hypothetical protein
MAKYILLETFVDRQGNLYNARSTPYEEGELPDSVTKNPLKVRKILDTQVAVYTSKSIETNIINLNTSDTPNVLVPKFLDPNPVIVDKVNINTASLEDIKNIKGIGEKTASLIIAERPFTDNTDLSTKVKPPLGKNWAEFNFIFNQPPIL